METLIIKSHQLENENNIYINPHLQINHAFPQLTNQMH